MYELRPRASYQAGVQDESREPPLSSSLEGIVVCLQDSVSLVCTLENFSEAHYQRKAARVYCQGANDVEGGK